MSDDNFVEASAASIRRLEGFSEGAYIDATGHSIGYGHFIKQGEEHLLGQRLTKEQSESLLKEDIAIAQSPWITQAKEMGLKQNQIVGLTSFAYNTGGKAIPRVLDMIKNGDMAGASALMRQYNKAYNPSTGQKEVRGFLEERRDTEVSMIGGSSRSFAGNIGVQAREIKDFITGKSGRLGRKADSESDVALGDLQAVAAGIADVSARLGRSDIGGEEYLRRLRQEGANQWAV